MVRCLDMSAFLRTAFRFFTLGARRYPRTAQGVLSLESQGGDGRKAKQDVERAYLVKIKI